MSDVQHLTLCIIIIILLSDLDSQVGTLGSVLAAHRADRLAFAVVRSSLALAIGSTRTVAWRSLASVARRQVRCLLPARLFVLDMQRVILVLRISSGFVFVFILLVCFSFSGITGEAVSLPSTCPLGQRSVV